MRNLILAAVLAVALAGCSGDDSSTSDQTPEERLAEAKTLFDDAEYVAFSLQTDELPDGLAGLLNADGTGTHEPAFTGEVEVQTDLGPITAPLVAVDDGVYADFPFTGWSAIDPAEYGAPDPAALMDTETGISSLFTAAEDVTEGESERDGDTILTRLDGTVPGEAVQEVFPSAGSSDFEAAYLLDDDNTVDSATFTGPFYDGYDDVSYTIDLDLDGDEVEIEAPI